MNKNMKFETIAIRTQTERGKEREHSTPIFPTSSFVFHNAEHMRSVFAGEEEGNVYSRFTNPNSTEFADKLAQLEGLPKGISCASGMSAILVPLMALLQQGDHIIATRALFGSTFGLLNNWFPKYGITCSFVEPDKPEEWEQAVQKNSKLLLLETPSNPGLAIVDLEKAGQFAKAHGLIYMVDNCFATPYLQQPAKYGADIVSHSATKFIDGQGRVIGGAVLCKEEFYEGIHGFSRAGGPALSPFNAWILSKSLETLHVRMDRHCSNALALAQQLEGHAKLNFVKYPHLTSHPQYEIAKKQMSQGGGIVTFELKGGITAGRTFLDAIQLLSLSANLGDSRSIVTHPASTTHARVPEEERLAMGITDGLVRVSVGLEHIDDITEDILRAIDQV